MSRRAERNLRPLDPQAPQRRPVSQTRCAVRPPTSAGRVGGRVGAGSSAEMTIAPSARPPRETPSDRRSRTLYPVDGLAQPVRAKPDESLTVAGKPTWVPSTTMGAFGAMRWGLAPDGRHHLVHTHPNYLSSPGVTPVAVCGADLEILTGSGTAWDERSPLRCTQCTTSGPSGQSRRYAD